MITILWFITAVILFLIGFKWGIHALAADFFFQNRISLDECNYISSEEYLWKKLKEKFNINVK